MRMYKIELGHKSMEKNEVAAEFYVEHHCKETLIEFTKKMISDKFYLLSVNEE